MTFPLFLLELRKNRLAAWAVLAAFVVTLPVARLVSSTTGMELTRALEAVLLVWMILGSPFAVALIASSAGALAASRDAREAEALWPASPLRRAAASLLAAAALAAVVSAVLVASAWAFGALGWLDTTRNPVMNWGRPFWMDASLSPVFFAALADALLSCWVLSYLIGHGVAGGLAGLLLTGATLTAAALGMGLQIEHHYWGLRMGPWFAAHGAATLALKAAAVVSAANWRERSTRLRPAGLALLVAALAFGPAAGWGVAVLAYRDLASRMKPADYAVRYNFTAPSFGDAPTTAAAVAAGAKATVTWSGTGALCLVGPGGVRRLLPPRRDGVIDTLFHHVVDGQDAGLDADGTLWATRWDYLKLELWREKDGAMELVRRENWPHAGQIHRIGNVLHLTYWNNDKTYYVPVAAFARQGLDARAAGEGLDGALAGAGVKAGLATHDCAPRGRCLRRGGRTWTFPGPRLQPGADAPAFTLGKETVYLASVKLKGSLWAMAARADGRVEKLWEIPENTEGSWYTDFSVLADGTLNAREPAGTLAWLGTDGKSGRLKWPPLRPRGTKGAPVLARLSDGRAWLLWENVLQEVSLDGRALAEHPVPVHTGWRFQSAGVLLHDEGRMSFVGWDGKVKRLDAPSS